MLTISTDDFLWFVDDCLDAMTEIVTGLGDELANTAPALPGANSPYAILTHCLGVIRWWGGVMIAGHAVDRDRDAEFVATGPVADVPAAVRRAREQLAEDLTGFDPTAPLAEVPDDRYRDRPYGRNQGAVLVHVFHELAQHLGHMELTRDVLLSRENGP